jgi:hypothetical protein
MIQHHRSARRSDQPIESLIVQSINHRYDLHTLNPCYAPVDRRPALRCARILAIGARVLLR